MKIIYANTHRLEVANYFGDVLYNEENRDGTFTISAFKEMRKLVADGHTWMNVSIIPASDDKKVLDIELDEGEVIIYTTNDRFQGVFTSFQAAKFQLEYGALSEIERNRHGIPARILVVDANSFAMKTDPSVLAVLVPEDRIDDDSFQQDRLVVVKVDAFRWDRMDYSV